MSACSGSFESGSCEGVKHVLDMDTVADADNMQLACPEHSPTAWAGHTKGQGFHLHAAGRGAGWLRVVCMDCTTCMCWRFLASFVCLHGQQQNGGLNQNFLPDQVCKGLAVGAWPLEGSHAWPSAWLAVLSGSPWGGLSPFVPAGWEHKVEEAKREEESRRQRKLQQKALKVSVCDLEAFHAEVLPGGCRPLLCGVKRLSQHSSMKAMQGVLQAAESEDEEEEMNPEMAAMMGFGGFGTTKQ